MCRCTSVGEKLGWVRKIPMCSPEVPLQAPKRRRTLQNGRADKTNLVQIRALSKPRAPRLASESLAIAASHSLREGPGVGARWVRANGPEWMVETMAPRNDQSCVNYERDPSCEICTHTSAKNPIAVWELSDLSHVFSKRASRPRALEPEPSPQPAPYQLR